MRDSTQSFNMSNPVAPGYEMFHFFEMTPDLVCIAGKDGFFKKINPAVINKLEYSEEELFKNPISSFIYKDDKDLTAELRSKLIKGQPLLNFQNRYVSKSGKIVWLEWTSLYFPDREIVFAIAKDITIRKTAELEIEEKYKKFKSLATHFKTSIEKEKKYLAIELHEELAQLASVVKMDIDWIKTHEKNLEGAMKDRVEHALAASGLLIDTIRRISFSISPNMLDDLGLDATLEWHSNEFSLLSGIPCVFESAYDEACLSREIKLDFFRIYQEALSNVMYHSLANTVKVRIEDATDEVCLTIVDDGCGFEFDKKAHSSGFTTMRQRVASINGHLSVKSEIGKGTLVRVAVPRHD